MNSVKHIGYICHVRVLSTGLAVAAVTDEDYPSFVVLGFLGKALAAFQTKYPEEAWKLIKKVCTEVQSCHKRQESDLVVPELTTLLAEYQDPTKADKIAQIQNELKEVQEIVLKSLDQLLVNGEKLNELAKQSQDLSFTTRAFVDNTKELNACCIIL